MPTITQYFPDFCEGFEKHTATVKSVEDLDRIEWIRSWRRDPAFYRFSLSLKRGDGGRPLLMAEFDGGKIWYVVGRLSEPLEGLSMWVAK
jgi:hypothetical protein